MDCIYISAVKRFIVINHIQNKVLVYIIYVYCVYLLCIYKYTHIQYIFWKHINILIFYKYIYVYMKSSFPKRYKSILIVFMKMKFFYLDPYILLIFNLSC